ncbi:hypothetical protein HG15A2_35710 [Adhaeretor mobilis]|uniref:Uncharacterized protein n=1 Tax=Adhaeretor mobilis TaxID=1930276 RepID=A0A517MZE5_9BACT|nr:hypothetical protein HG15A2_35710 [Adhaeretor mobilis]
MLKDAASALEHFLIWGSRSKVERSLAYLVLFDRPQFGHKADEANVPLEDRCRVWRLSNWRYTQFWENGQLNFTAVCKAERSQFAVAGPGSIPIGSDVIWDSQRLKQSLKLRRNGAI